MFLYSQQNIPIQEIIADFRDDERVIENIRQLVSQLSNGNQSVLARFDHLVSVLKSHFLEVDSNFPLSKLLEAILFAADKHQLQTRKDVERTPYIIHPMGVALSLWEEGQVRDPDVLIAALLHDTLEDTDATKEELADRFGENVSRIVSELTNPPGLSSEESKAWQIEHAPSLSFEARLVKLSDRLYNLRDLKNSDWDEEKIQRYFEWGGKLLNALRGTNPGIEHLLQSEINANLKDAPIVERSGLRRLKSENAYFNSI